MIVERPRCAGVDNSRAQAGKVLLHGGEQDLEGAVAPSTSGETGPRQVDRELVGQPIEKSATLSWGKGGAGDGRYRI